MIAVIEYLGDKRFIYKDKAQNQNDAPLGPFARSFSDRRVRLAGRYYKCIGLLLFK